jgi:hypothetical protein
MTYTQVSEAFNLIIIDEEEKLVRLFQGNKTEAFRLVGMIWESIER